MKYIFQKTVVIALGGSIVHPEEIDVSFLKQFKVFIAPFLRRGTRFVLVVGGGYLARKFQEAASDVARLTDDDRDWLGIHATRLNAHLMRTIFRDVADPVVFDARGKIKKLRRPITIASGWRPGWSTDFVAAAIARDLGAKEFIVAGKPAHVYHKDPGVYKDVEPYSALAWHEYRKLIPGKWIPGFHAPVDPVAAKLSHRAKLKSIIIHGKDLKNFDKLLRGKEFKGTVIG